MKKNQSKKMNLLKYLLLIPVIVSMLFYTSCASKQVKKELSNLEKKLNEERVIKESQIKELTQINQKLGDSIVKLNEDRKFHLKTVNFLKKKIYNVSSKEYVETEEVSFLKIDKAPTFPGCDSGDKACFSKGVQKHFIKNFDSKLPNTLGLEAGRKRVFIGFKVDKEGNVVDINARAPHPKIKDEVIRVMNTLPKVIPGEQDGKKVAVKYSIPFTIFIGKKDK